MNGREKDETLEERTRRLERQAVHSEDELRKSPEEAEERVEQSGEPPDAQPARR
ncbi:hypothetical protein [Roseomonas sp. KE2513]|uniref:hypothetical protein n=1 Tax=Roseomonas sp. KE2513 TaxID=2479202 RepID=UPI0018DFF999|nr:hypothetical protein [Roseomonas sp. KE2513]